MWRFNVWIVWGNRPLKWKPLAAKLQDDLGFHKYKRNILQQAFSLRNDGGKRQQIRGYSDLVPKVGNHLENKQKNHP